MKNRQLFSGILVGVMTALATVIYLIFPEIPLVPGVEYLKIDLSDIPALITGLSIGPVYGILVELLKNLLHLFRTTTFGIGEAINLGIGTVMVIGMHIGCFPHGRDVKLSPLRYYLSAVVTILLTVIAGWLLNLLLTPLFYTIMHWPLTKATLMAGVWGSTLLNAIKCAVTVLPFYPVICIVRKNGLDK